MRWPRAGIVVGLIGLVLLGAGWWLASVGAAGPVDHRSSSGAVAHRTPPATGSPAPKSLLGALRLYLARSNPVAPRPNPLPRPLTPGPLTPRNLASVNGTTCPVAAGGFCSLTPCVVYAGGGGGVASVTAEAGAAVLQTVPTVRPGPPPGSGTCQGQAAPPRTLRVVGPAPPTFRLATPPRPATLTP